MGKYESREAFPMGKYDSQGESFYHKENIPMEILPVTKDLCPIRNIPKEILPVTKDLCPIRNIPKEIGQPYPQEEHEKGRCKQV